MPIAAVIGAEIAIWIVVQKESQADPVKTTGRGAPTPKAVRKYWSVGV
jgi:hypothetical protein